MHIFPRPVEYACRAMAYMALKGGHVPIVEICERQGMPRNYLVKILKTLVEKGLVKVRHGYRGGYALARGEKEISVFEIFEAMRGPFTVDPGRCLVGSPDRHDQSCPCVRMAESAIEAQRAIYMSWTLDHLANNCRGQNWKRPNASASAEAAVA